MCTYSIGLGNTVQLNILYRVHIHNNTYNTILCLFVIQIHVNQRDKLSDVLIHPF